MNRIFLKMVLIGLLTNLLFAQAPQISWLQTYDNKVWAGGDGIGYAVQQTFDGGFIIAGDIWPAGGNQLLRAIKTDASGDTLWQRSFGVGWPGGARCIKQTPNNSYIMGGYIPGDAYLLCLDTGGNALWTQNFKYPNTQWNGINAVEFTPDSGFIMTGWSNPYANDQLFLCKTDSLGNPEWMKTYGTNTNNIHDVGVDIKRISSGGYIVVGNTLSFGNGAYDIYMLKVDENGDTLWTKTYGGPANDAASTVWETPDHGFIILGNTRSFGPGIPNTNAYLIRTNSFGDTLWTQTYNNDIIYDESMHWLCPTQDSGYVMAGGSQDMVWVIKINSGGDTLWGDTYDIGIHESAYSIIESSDGRYILTGGVKFGSSGMPYRTFLLKLESTTSIPENQHSIPHQFNLEQNYPNPFNPTTTIKYYLSNMQLQETTLKIYNSSGQLVKTLVTLDQIKGEYNVIWDGCNNFGYEVSSGIYFYELRSGNYSDTRKLLKMK